MCSSRKRCSRFVLRCASTIPPSLLLPFFFSYSSPKSRERRKKCVFTLFEDWMLIRLLPRRLFCTTADALPALPAKKSTSSLLGVRKEKGERKLHKTLPSHVSKLFLGVNTLLSSRKRQCVQRQRTFAEWGQRANDVTMTLQCYYHH